VGARPSRSDSASTGTSRVNQNELRELITNGEGSGVELKRDEVEPHELAKEVVAFANFAGGVIVLGVEDDGRVFGTTRAQLEEWVAELCRASVDPPLIPYFEWFRGFEPGRDVAVVRILTGPDKPYAHVRKGRRTYLIRVGSTNREASTDELQRMFQAAGRLLYGMKPAPGGRFEDLDQRRLRNYFEDVLAGEAPSPSATSEWIELLTNVDLMVREGEVDAPTIDGLLLFGRNPKRHLPQSGVRGLVFAGEESDYAAQADEELRGPLAPLLDSKGEIVEAGLVDQALAFVQRNTRSAASLEGGRRVDRDEYPPEVLREIIVNAVVHRDYSIRGVDVTLLVFSDRLEVVSPGRLPNTVSLEGLRAGARYARNQTLVNVMRDYGYVDFRGMGVRNKAIPGMLAHNGTEPEFEEPGESLRVRLLKDQAP